MLKIASYASHGELFVTSICPFEFANCGNERKKLLKLKYLEKKRTF